MVRGVQSRPVQGCLVCPVGVSTFSFRSSHSDDSDDDLSEIIFHISSRMFLL